MQATPFKIDRWDQLPGVISRLQAAGAAHSAVPFQGLYRGMIAYLAVHRGTRARHIKHFLSAARLPALVTIGDDDDFPSGPEGWTQAPRLLKWARKVIVHAGPGHPVEYEIAVAETLLIRRVVLVETGTVHAEAWRLAAVAARPDHSVHILLPAHGPHPVPRAREAMQ